MPHVTVHFDPTRVEQQVINKLKRELKAIVASALSSQASRGPIWYALKFLLAEIETSPEEIYVRQAPAHETDVNPAPIEIVVDAGRAKGRSADAVAQIIDQRVRRLRLIPETAPGDDMSCIWVIFHEKNGFRFVG